MNEMKRLLLLSLACLCAGCVHTTTRDRRGFAGIGGAQEDAEPAIVVHVRPGGVLELFGRRYDRAGLVDKLIDFQGGVVTDDSRMIVLKGHEGVTIGELASLQAYLVDRRLYRVSVETPRTASAEGNQFVPFLPEGGLQVEILDPDDPIARALDE